MRIAVNTRLLLKDKLEGIGVFSLETLQRITRQHPEHQFIFFFDRDYDPEFIFSGNITPVKLFPQARHPLLFYWWFEYAVARALKKFKADLFLSPDGYIPLSSPVTSVAVIHDLNFEHHPENLPFAARNYYRYFFPKFARRADRIATVSAFSKQDIMTHYGIPAEKIDVVYNGAGDKFRPLDLNEKQAVRIKYSGGAEYFVFVGSLQPRKNIARLLEAYEQFREAEGKEIKLLLAGEKRWWTSEMESVYEHMHYRKDVVFTGRLPAAEVAGVLGAASVLIYVPCFEGFGIPILEAMACDVPVITSGITSMPEVAGDAALYADPFSASSITAALHKLVSDEKLRETLVSKGRLRRAHFSWQKTSDALWNCLMKAAGKE